MSNESVKLTNTFTVLMDYPQTMQVIMPLLQAEGWSQTPWLSYTGVRNVWLPTLRSAINPSVMGKHVHVTDQKGNYLTISVTTNLWGNTYVSSITFRGESRTVNTTGMMVLRRRMDHLRHLIEHAARTMAPSATNASPRIFISYRRSESDDIAHRIYTRLTEHFTREAVFKDIDTIPLGTDFREHILNAVQHCQVLLAIIGPHWLDVRNRQGQRRLEDPQDYVRFEIEAALERNIQLIPLFVGGAPSPQPQQLPPSLEKLAYAHGMALRYGVDFDHDMEQVVTALRKLLV